jgi:Domain of unknown function (DUF5916)/Carbohydrate family 9 binding domain-like
VTLRNGAIFLCLLAAPPASAEPDPSPAKRVEAVRVPNHALHLDGRLDEVHWNDAGTIKDFVQKEPIFGAPPSEAMEIRFAYDDDALWVAARMQVRDRELQAPLTRRDNALKSEHLWISLDTYQDKRTAYSFGVSASGARLDFLHRSDSEDDRDNGYDPVWQARTRQDKEGWTAEFRIPFSQLRFNAHDAQVWGLNVDRWIPSRNEDVFWIAIPKDETGWSSRMGELHGISGIKPSRRVELRPYAAATGVAGEDEGTPFRDGWAQRARAGLDVKMGLGPNLTLESTIRPDFGQVEADPAEVNLSAFETFFPERRPFFTEGASIFNGVRGYFYSRRIGGAPRGAASGDAVEYPRSSEIVTATKLTGRLASGLSVGGLFALTNGEEARVFDARSREVRKVRVGPRASYGVLRLRQELGDNGSGVGVFFSGVARDIDRDDPLAALYTRTAFATALDFTHRFSNRRYRLGGNLGYTRVAGEASGIERLQRSSARYFQRPDLTHVRLDPRRKSLEGGSGGFNFSKAEGNWTFGVFTGFESPETERNDIGSLQGADDRYIFGTLGYRQNKPGFFYRWETDLRVNASENFAGDVQERKLEVSASATWRNFWETSVEVNLTGAAQDQRLTRGGPSMGTPRGYKVDLSGGNPPQSPRRFFLSLEAGGDEDGGSEREVRGSFSLQASTRVSIQLNPRYNVSTTVRQYVTALTGGRPATFGTRYIFAAVDQRTLLAQFRASLILKPDLTLDVYAEPFAASGRYRGHGELVAPRGRGLLVYGENGTQLTANPDGTQTVRDGNASFTIEDDNFKELSFRSNVVLRWEYRPGSTLYAVWQQNRADSAAYSRAGFSDVLDSLSARGDNIFAVKASFFWGGK